MIAPKTKGVFRIYNSDVSYVSYSWIHHNVFFIEHRKNTPVTCLFYEIVRLKCDKSCEVAFEKFVFRSGIGFEHQVPRVRTSYFKFPSPSVKYMRLPYNG
jgi:hypothetical protein